MNTPDEKNAPAPRRPKLITREEIEKELDRALADTENQRANPDPAGFALAFRLSLGKSGRDCYKSARLQTALGVVDLVLLVAFACCVMALIFGPHSWTRPVIAVVGIIWIVTGVVKTWNETNANSSPRKDDRND